MIQSNLISFLLFTLIFIGACSKSTTTNPNPTACTDCEGILAKAALDGSAKGVYKGIAVSGEGIGHFKLYYENDSPKTYMIFKFTRKGNYSVVNDSMIPTTSIISNPSGITQFTLVGGISKNTASLATPPNYSSLTDFTLSGTISSGPKPQSSMMKELSTQEVKIYEGTMTLTGSTNEAGKIGFVVRGNKISGIITGASNTPREGFYYGTIGSDNKFSFSFSGNNSVYEGSITNDKDISGTITIGGSPYGAFTATRAY